MKRVISLILALLLITLCAGCGSTPSPAAGTPAKNEEPEKTDERDTEGSEPDDETEETNMEKVLRLYINDVEVAVDWEDNESVSVLRELVSPEPLTVQMSMYGGFEQVGPLGKSLPRNDSQTTTAAGDIVLYSGNQIVIFYGSNSWAYTRLGHITDRDDAGMAALLGNGNVTITISMEG